jgi:hypothetical protein
VSRRHNQLSQKVTGRVAEDPRQGWLFPTEELLNQGVIVSRRGDSAQDSDAEGVAAVPTEREAA